MKMPEQDIPVDLQYDRGNVCEKLAQQRFMIPESARKNERELDAWILFAEVNDEARTVFGEDWDNDAARAMINESLATLERMRDTGYHDKTHPIRFAATYLAQAIEVRRMLNAGANQELNSFVEKRLGSGRLTKDTEGRLLWSSNGVGEPVDVVNQLRDEYNTAHVQEVLCAAFEHDSEEQDTTKETHEAAYAQKVDEKHRLRAQMVLSTRYTTAKRSVQNPYDHLENPIEIVQDGGSYKFDLRSDSIATHLSARMFASCDYIEMFARDGYVDRSWYLLANIPELSNTSDRQVIKNKNTLGSQITALATRIKLLEEAVRETTPAELNALRSKLQKMVESALQDNPLAMLWGEMFSGDADKAVGFLKTTDLAVAIGSMGFPNYQLSVHRASVDLLAHSHLPENIKSNFASKLPNFQEAQFQEAWMKSDSPGVMERLVRFYLHLNTKMTDSEKTNLARIFGYTYESFVKGMLTFETNPKEQRFDFNRMKSMLSFLCSQSPMVDG